MERISMVTDHSFGIKGTIDDAVYRLSAIEDILGDDYDLDRLKELVQADREGKCVLLPCKVGDKLYKISENGVKEVVVQSIVFMLSHTVNHLTVHVANERGAMTEIETKDFGKTVFLTREDAEAALEEMKESDSNDRQRTDPPRADGRRAGAARVYGKKDCVAVSVLRKQEYTHK